MVVFIPSGKVIPKMKIGSFSLVLWPGLPEYGAGVLRLVPRKKGAGAVRG